MSDPDADATTDHPDLAAHHVGITVRDLDSVLEFYRDVLGLRELDRFSVSGPAFAAAVGVEGATGSFCHLDAGDARVELIEYEPAGDATTTETINQSGATHLGLSTADVDAVYGSLPADVETLSEPRTTESGSRILFVRDPEGNLVELIEA